MRVSIGGQTHQVEVEVDHTDLSYVIGLAQKLWTDTLPAEPRLGAATGFQVIERAGDSCD